MFRQKRHGEPDASLEVTKHLSDMAPLNSLEPVQVGGYGGGRTGHFCHLHLTCVPDPSCTPEDHSRAPPPTGQSGRRR
jgi:hypothetical protein